MESPPSFSTHSEVPPLSEDSGLFITSGSFSSDSASGWHQIASELQESDYDEKSLSFCGDSADTPEHMCGANFNTVKKGPAKLVVTTIEPPLEFQDNPVPAVSIASPPAERPDATYEPLYNARGLGAPMSRHASPLYGRKLKPELYERRAALGRYAPPRLLHLSPGRAARPASRASLASRLSSSHNSLVTQFQADDSSFITQAISHDTLSAHTADITDMYNVPFDSDIYAVPVDMVRPALRHKGKKQPRPPKKRKSVSHPVGVNYPERNHKTNEKAARLKDTKSKRHSLQGTSSKKIAESDSDSLHMTLREMRKYLHTLYSSSSESENRNTVHKKICSNKIDTMQSKHKDMNGNGKPFSKNTNESKNVETNNNNKKPNKNALVISKCKKLKENADDKLEKKSLSGSSQKSKISPVRILSINLKQSFCNLFRWRRASPVGGGEACAGVEAVPPAVKRALPPLPQTPPQPSRRGPSDEETVTDFATSIQKVKDYGWYWGNMSSSAAEKILSNEPDGSFIVRDSSDDHYIFTLTFKLNGLRHVRIEHDQGNFCFGGCTMFKAATIVEFIENAVETSRSGRYLFFLNLRPVLGPVRVQLLYPVSRFKRVQSLQHMCRFVILKHVRRDLVSSLPLPRRMVDYLSAPHYYSEMLSEI